MEKLARRLIRAWFVCAIFAMTADVCLASPPQPPPGDPPRFWISSPSLRRIERPVNPEGEKPGGAQVDPPASDVGGAGPITRAMNPNPNGWRQEELAREWQLLDAQAPNVVLRSKVRLPNVYSFDAAGKLVVKPGGDGKQVDAFLRVPLGQRGGNNLDLAFELIASTPSGQKLLEKFDAKLKAGRVAVRPLDYRVRGDVEGLINGVCHTDPATGFKIVSVDPYDTLGKMAAVLFHEVFHSVSDEQWQSRKKLLERQDQINALWYEQQKAAGKAHRISFDQYKLVPDEWFPADKRRELLAMREKLFRDWEQLTFNIERETHDAHEKFIAEVVQIYPDAKGYFDHLNKTRSLPYKTTDEQIIYNYGLDTMAIGVQKCMFMRRI